jgi:hypothetical protein
LERSARWISGIASQAALLTITWTSAFGSFPFLAMRAASGGVSCGFCRSASHTALT